MNKQQFVLTTIIGVCLYLISTGLSFAAFTTLGGLPAKKKAMVSLQQPTPPPGSSRFVVDPSIPRTEVCPLNGVLYTAQEKAVWEKHRPLGVMIENHADSRPQSGLSYADVVYEAVAEGGVTRFFAVFYCGISAKGILVAPVRSARMQFLPWVLEYDALYNHVGGAGRCNDDTVDERAKALCQIGQFKIKDMDQFGISFPTCYRNYDRLDHPVATEHTMVCDTDKLYTLAATRGWTNVDAKGIAWDKNFESWKFKDDAASSERGTTTRIQFVAWAGYDNEYGVQWDYDAAANMYKRTNGGAPHKDLETNEQLSAKALIVMFAKETATGDIHHHIIYNTIGEGKGLLFQDGTATEVTWRKATRNARTKFFDKSNREVKLNKGQIWIEMLPIGANVTY